MISRVNFVQFQMTNFKKLNLIDTLKRYKLMGYEYLDPIHILDESTVSKSTLPDCIKELEEHANNCNLCDLSKKRHSFNFAQGGTNSGILIVGTNHNILDDQKLFELLKNMLEKVLLLDIDDVYITNILKCNSNIPYNQSSVYIDTCIEYLLKQINILKPKLIITFGDSFNSLIKTDDNIFDISGNLYNFNGVKLIPLYDLEFIYKNPSYKQNVFKDLLKIKNILENL